MSLYIRLVAVVCILFLAACAREKESPLDSRSIPAGYEVVDSAFGVRTGGLVHEVGAYRMPVVEFRTGDEYALYSVTTECDGRFVRSAGTVFARDGTIRSNIGAQPAQTVSAAPLFEALIERICRDAKAKQYVSDPFKPQDALALLFGSLDANDEAQWDYKGGDGLNAGTMKIALRMSGEFNEGQRHWAYILTSARAQQCEGNVCAGAIGAALFRFGGGKWELISHIPLVMTLRRDGIVTDGGIKDLQPGKLPLISAVYGDCDGGDCFEETELLSVVDGKFAVVWEGLTFRGTMSTPMCEESGECDDWVSELQLMSSRGYGLPDIQVVRTGKMWDQVSEKLFELNEKVIYRFDPAGRYQEISRTGKPVETQLPHSSPAMGPENSPVATAASPAMENVDAPVCVGPDRGASPSRLLTNPNYPPSEMRERIEGTVVLVLDIDADGGLTGVEVGTSSGNNNLDQSAMRSARNWRFNPAIKDCKFVASRINMPVNFKIGAN